MPLDKFTRAYLTTALWAETDNSTPQGGEPLDKKYRIKDFAPEALARAVNDCLVFQAANRQDIIINLERAGHDFWLTRNGHGAGFWDGDWPKEAGERLTEASKKFGQVNIEVANGKLYFL